MTVVDRRALMERVAGVSASSSGSAALAVAARARPPSLA